MKISRDHHFLETETGEPFFWMGDTAWELLHTLNREEIIKYLDDRKQKGFSVIQTVILAELNGLNLANAYGEKPLLQNNPARINEKYFTHLDFLLKEADKRGLYIGLLPTWGDKFNKKWGIGPEVFTPENAEAYGLLLGKRYRNNSNIIWILGGDRVPETEEQYEIINSLARGLKTEDPNHLISYHPSGGKIASNYIDEEWLDIDMFQSGHSSLAKEYEYIQNRDSHGFIRPVINGEARYEDIPDRFWEEEDFGRLDATDIRISAYWSLLAGAAGYTYGSNDIWQMYSEGKIPSLDARLGWKKAMGLPGAQQMKYLREFFTSFEWEKLQPAQNLISSENPEDTAYVAASQAADFALFYTPEGRSFQVNLDHLNFKTSEGYWFNPRSGTSIEIAESNIFKNNIFKTPSSGKGQDWLLVLLSR
ncbi:glycoside hydrolase family 140 protein [Christiangramia fulva]|uniref:glycoside hydrolase family 140 protein n=1 Tax=Christiangramia fulva TaxID=2126553 RepID=UPI001D057EF0|nr:glycoside hydrolase family 140 protein [Christiangramia fulva]